MRILLPILFICAFTLSACGAAGKGEAGHPSQEEKTAFGSNWDEMKWDQGKWK